MPREDDWRDGNEGEGDHGDADLRNIENESPSTQPRSAPAGRASSGPKSFFGREYWRGSVPVSRQARKRRLGDFGILKITPDHLDHHKTFEEYKEAKMNITKFQTAGDVVIQNAELDPRLRGGGGKGSGSEIGLLGKFNEANVAAAVAAVKAAGAKDFEIIKKIVREFKGLPHRLEFVAEKEGVKYYDDSFSTTPETAMAALTAFDTPIILIAGGSEKNSDYTELGKTI